MFDWHKELDVRRAPHQGGGLICTGPIAGRSTSLAYFSFRLVTNTLNLNYYKPFQGSKGRFLSATHPTSPGPSSVRLASSTEDISPLGFVVRWLDPLFTQ